MLRKTMPMGALEATLYSTSMFSSIDSSRPWPTAIHLLCCCELLGGRSNANASWSLLSPVHPQKPLDTDV